MIAIAGIGLLAQLLMRDIPMGSVTDDSYGLDVKKEQVGEEGKVDSPSAQNVSTTVVQV